MTLRTPRRRISPQTRRRCKAIKGFFKRALGNVPQSDLLQITSSIAVNVTDINHKIVGIEKQLQEVCKTCRDNLQGTNSVRSSSLHTPTNSRNVISQREHESSTELKARDTTLIYSKSDNHYANSNPSNCAFRTSHAIDKKISNNTMNIGFNEQRVHKLKKKKSKVNNKDMDANLQKYDTVSSNFVSSYSTSSFHSLDQFKKMCYTMPDFSDNVAEKRKRTKGPNRCKTHRKPSPKACEEKAENVKYGKSRSDELDQDFIADIIRRQYKPIKFGRRNSDLSQFSVPVCRDREFCLTPDCYNIPEERQLCNCGVGHYNKLSRHSDCSDMKSVCDARFYNMTQTARTKHQRMRPDAYDNSDIYDLVPVKEKSSPKSRRKFFEDNMRTTYYKEVPPSPKTLRPQLNLKARCTESDYNLEFGNNSGKRISNKHTMRRRETEENYHQYVNRDSIILPKSTRQGNEEFIENYDPPGIQKRKINNNLKHADLQLANSNVISGICPVLANEDLTAPVVAPLNKTQETVASDKTDQALCEIKDILQSFLLEIKKEASSHHQKSNVSTKMAESGNGPLNNANIMTSTRHSCSDFNSAHCPVAPLSPYMPAIPAFGNTCCYPLMPICPINCMQNSYAMPSGSSTQNNCVDKSNKTCNVNIDTNETCETDELIKKIYNFVSQSPTFCRKNSSSRGGSDSNQELRTRNKALTSRSVGGSTRFCRHDAKVGTPKRTCVSKSCEAIKLPSESSDANASYSDTVLDKLSLEATTQSLSDTESSTEISEVKKSSKFAKVLNSLGITSKKTQNSKKSKKDVIEELSESESTTVEEVKKKPPFHQNITNYAIHDQQYYNPPPISPHYHPEYSQEKRLPYNCDGPYWDPRMQQSGRHVPPPQCRSGGCSTAPYPQPYEGYHHMQPQVPLCLKEVEVKSIGCQSERKFSFFQKMTQKMQQTAGSTQDNSYQRHNSTQTLQTRSEKPQNNGMFNWKNRQSKFMDSQINPAAFGYQTQKKLAQGDMKMRNAMLKKMFHKRNPFSPRNLIIKTLLGKDKSSFGEPTMTFRPRLFM